MTANDTELMREWQNYRESVPRFTYDEVSRAIRAAAPEEMCDSLLASLKDTVKPDGTCDLFPNDEILDALASQSSATAERVKRLRTPMRSELAEWARSRSDLI